MYKAIETLKMNKKDYKLVNYVFSSLFRSAMVHRNKKNGVSTNSKIFLKYKDYY